MCFQITNLFKIRQNIVTILDHDLIADDIEGGGGGGNTPIHELYRYVPL